MDETPAAGTRRWASNSGVLVSLLLGLSVLAVFAVMALPGQTLSWLRSEFWVINWPLSWLESHGTLIDFDHVAMFVVLGFFWKLLSPATRWWRLALMMLTLAAATELMQYVVPGRTPKLLDVRDDMLGGVMGWCLGWFALRVLRWIGALLGRRPAVVGPVEGVTGDTRDEAP